jgi:nitrite reductase/ring-hydroxylating ferredoxin subunit
VHPEARNEILRRLLAASRERDAGAQPSSLSIDRYLDPAVLQQERVVLFRKQPLIVAHVSELPGPGDFMTEDVAGVPLLIVRDESGEVRVLRNLCRHQGVRLVDESQGCGRKAFTCLYHAWRYGLDGSLLDIAGREVPGGLIYPGLELRAVAHEVRHGFVWVRLDGNPGRTDGDTIDVAGFLGPVLDVDFAHFALAGHQVARKNVHVRACNWKLVMDALVAGHPRESVHRPGTHLDLEAAVVDDCTPHVRHVRAHPDALEHGAGDAWDLRRHTKVFYNVFPSSVLIFHPRWVSQLGLFPDAVDRVRVVHRMLIASPSAGDERERLDRSFLHLDGEVLAGENLALAERLQGTLGSAAHPEVQLGEREHGMRLFHQAWDRVMSAH